MILIKWCFKNLTKIRYLNPASPIPSKLFWSATKKIKFLNKNTSSAVFLSSVQNSCFENQKNQKTIYLKSEIHSKKKGNYSNKFKVGALEFKIQITFLQRTVNNKN